jgi:ABC-type nickel/cobalt efflux system permease component RcnA
MTPEIKILLFTAASIAFLHTLLGPDHYLPFIIMAKTGKWSKMKTFWVTALCGAGHVGGSVILGIIGIAMGLAISRVQFIESWRGDIAAWLLIAFGFVYFVWGLRKAYKNKPHKHIHMHEDGSIHAHEHKHELDHSHIHKPEEKKSITPWVLFLIFALGPCEPLIPLLMYPAARHNTLGLITVTIVFGAITITTMLSLVFLTLKGIDFLPLKKMERYTHAMGGAALCLTGIFIIILGL